jgi:DNA-binding NtrC family response regulator
MTLQPYVYANDVFGNDRPRRRTILLVEDEPFVREATCSILESAGFEVLPAEDARVAMKVYEECKRGIDLVMTDMVLPGRTGLQLGQDLREQSPEVVVLMTSGYDNPEYETESPESRTYFLAKPYSKRTLVEKIEKILGAATLARRATQAG